MRKDNPAVYECPKSHRAGMHYWKVDNTTGTATCNNCKLTLNQDDTADMLWVPKDSR